MKRTKNELLTTFSKKKKTHKTPTKNLVTINIEMFSDKLDNADEKKVSAEHICIAFFLPRVSAKYPQKWELITMPRYAAPFKIPFSLSEGFKTQSASTNGKIKPIFNDSTITIMRHMPQASRRSLWKNPFPVDVLNLSHDSNSKLRLKFSTCFGYCFIVGFTTHTGNFSHTSNHFPLQRSETSLD